MQKLLDNPTSLRDSVKGFVIASKVIACATQVDKGRVILARHLQRLLQARSLWVFTFDRWSPNNRVRPIQVCPGASPDPLATRLLESSAVLNDARLDPLLYQAMQVRKPAVVALRSQFIADTEWLGESAGITPRLLGPGEALVGFITLDCGGALLVAAAFPAHKPLRPDGAEARALSGVLRRLRRLYRCRGLGSRGVLGVAQYDGLTRREEQVLRSLLAGASIKKIAEQLGVKEQTVAGYVKSVYRHFDVHSRGELMAKHLQL